MKVNPRLFEKNRPAFLLAELNRFSEMLCREEDKCSARVDRFIKLVTALIAAVVALFTISPNDQVLSLETLVLITTALMVGLCLFGIVTFVDVVRGQMSINRWIVRLNMIGRIFTGELQFENFIPFSKTAVTKLVKKRFKDKLVGGMSTVVMAISIGLGFASAGILANWLGVAPLRALMVSVLIGIVVFVIEFIAMYRLTHKVMKETLKNPNN